jgi:hypothetical protein
MAKSQRSPKQSPKSKNPKTTKVFNDPVLDDFRNFLFLLWSHLGLPEPTRIQYDIAHWMQYGPDRMIIEAFRGVGKSFIAAAFCLWQKLRSQAETDLLVSGSKEKTDQSATFMWHILNSMRELSHLVPLDEQRTSKVAFDVRGCPTAQMPSVKSTGIFGQITGSRAHFIWADDVETLQNSDTQGKREKLLRAIEEFSDVILPGGRICFLGTPQTEETVYHKLLEKGFELRVWPGRYPTPDAVERYGDTLAPIILEDLKNDPSLGEPKWGVEHNMGRPTDPRRFDEDDLCRRELEKGRSGFRMQFMLDPSMSDQDRYPLKLRDLIVTGLDANRAPEEIIWGTRSDLMIKDVPLVGFIGDRYYGPAMTSPTYRQYNGKVMFIDPAGRGKDELAYSTVGELNSQLYWLDMGAFQHGYDDPVLEALALAAKRFKVTDVIIESNFGDGMFSKLLVPFLQRAGHRCNVEEVHSVGQKELRIIDTLEPVLNQHRLIVDSTLIEKDRSLREGAREDEAVLYQAFYQLSRRRCHETGRRVRREPGGRDKPDEAIPEVPGLGR